MKIGIQTWGSEGDLRPFIALSRGLVAAGHEVTFSSADLFSTVRAEVVASSGAKAWRSLGPARGGQEPATRPPAAAEPRSRSARFELLLEQLLYPLERDLFEDAERLCCTNDLVVSHCLLYPLAVAAAKHRTPRVVVHLAPVQPSRAWVPSGVPHMGGALNGLFWLAARRYFDRTFGPPAERLFRKNGLTPPTSVLDALWSSPLLNLVAVSPVLFPQPRDWPAHTVVSGALLPREEPLGGLSGPLERFLADGPAPVFATFGTAGAVDEDALRTAGTLVDAILRAGRRGIVQSNWTRAASIPQHPDVFRLTAAPHAAIFPRCAAVVHHGGAGTTHAVARAGRPSIVVEHFADQRFWGDLLHRAGVAAAPLERRSLTAERLARSIREVCTAPLTRARALRMGEAMRFEDGVRSAVERIGALAAAGR